MVYIAPFDYVIDLRTSLLHSSLQLNEVAMGVVGCAIAGHHHHEARVSKLGSTHPKMRTTSTYNSDKNENESSNSGDGIMCVYSIACLQYKTRESLGLLIYDRDDVIVWCSRE